MEMYTVFPSADRTQLSVASGIDITGLTKLLKAFAVQHKNATMEDMSRMGSVLTILGLDLSTLPGNVLRATKSEPTILLGRGETLECRLKSGEPLYLAVPVLGPPVASFSPIDKKDLAKTNVFADLPDLETWVKSGRTGLSSKAMAQAIFKIPLTDSDFPFEKKSYPRDPADLSRCVDFLKAVPAARDGLAKVAKLSPTWDALIRMWDTLEVSLEKEMALGNGKAPETYRLMKQAIDQSKGCSAASDESNENDSDMETAARM